MKRLNAVLFAAILGVAWTAVAASLVAGGGDDDDGFKAKLRGFQEVPVVSTTGRGNFEAKLSEDGLSFTYRLRFSGLEGEVRQAHIHLGQPNVNGAIVIWLCETTAASDGAPEGDPADSPTCPQSGEVTGEVTAADVRVASTQGIAAGELGAVIAAMKAGMTYANVHSTMSPGGEIRGQIKDE